MHHTGEVISFYKNGNPALITYEELYKAVAKVAAASLIARHWTDGTRHSASLALAGGLFNAGWSYQNTEIFIEAVALAAKDEEVKDRITAVETTYQRFSDGEQVTGFPRLC